MTALRRLAVGRYAENQAISLDSAVALGHSLAASEHLLPLETVLDDILAFALTAAEAARLRHGQAVTPDDPGQRATLDRLEPGAVVSACCGGMLIALVVARILQITGSYVLVFLIPCSAYLVALGIIHLLAPRLEPVTLP